MTTCRRCTWEKGVRILCAWCAKAADDARVEREATRG